MRGSKNWRTVGGRYRRGFLVCCLGLILCSLIIQPPLVQPTLGLPGPEAASDDPLNESATAPNPKLWKVPLDQDEKTLQLLNRITFGPRPADVERVRQMGLKTFLDQQLHPEKIDDSAIETRVAQLPTLAMSNKELAKTFRELRAERLEQQRRGQAALPSD